MKYYIFHGLWFHESVFHVAYYQQLLLLHAWKIFSKSAYLTDYKTIFHWHWFFWSKTATSLHKMCICKGNMLRQDEYCSLFIVTHEPTKIPDRMKIFKRKFSLGNFLCCRLSFPTLLWKYFRENIFECWKEAKNWIND